VQGAHTATDRLGNTMTEGYGTGGGGAAEHSERPNFIGGQVHHINLVHGKIHGVPDADHGDEGPEMYTEMPH
jgi:hypothetical protein